MSEPRYLIAKYIPDMRRVEPHNIGVILWTPEGLAARFLAEDPDKFWQLDGRRIPSFVTSPSAYRQWVEYWRDQLDKREIAAVAQPDRKAAKGSSDFLDILAESSKGNFVLADGGVLLDAASDPQDAADYLFATLVESSNATDEPRDATLDDLCEKMVERAGIRGDAHFREDFDVECTVTEHLRENFRFSYAYQNGSLQRLYQRVPLPRQQSLQRKTIHDAAWTFEKVVAADLIRKENVISLA